jgi:hypothetical protein
MRGIVPSNKAFAVSLPATRPSPDRFAIDLSP